MIIAQYRCKLKETLICFVWNNSSEISFLHYWWLLPTIHDYWRKNAKEIVWLKSEIFLGFWFHYIDKAASQLQIRLIYSEQSPPPGEFQQKTMIFYEHHDFRLISSELLVRILVRVSNINISSWCKAQPQSQRSRQRTRLGQTMCTPRWRGFC